MIRLFLGLLILTGKPALGQGKPEAYRTFRHETTFLVNNLVLSSDSIFFYSSSCECGKEYFGKGKWEITRDTLFLYGFDSTKSYPNYDIKFVNEQSADSVTIYVYDYFNRPMNNLFLGLISNSNTTTLETEYKSADSLGRFHVSKSQYRGFYLLYEGGNNKWIGDKNPYYSFEKGTKQIIINVNFAQPGLDREPVPVNYGIQKFQISNGDLYDMGGQMAYKHVY